MSLVAKSGRGEGLGLRFFGAAPRVPAEAEYHFLLGRYIDTATLARASALAARWGVHPHEVLIANGWLDANDYYRALAGTCDAPFKAALLPGAAMPPGGMTPRQCLANGLVRERTSYVMAGDRLRPNALRVMLARLGRNDLVLASPASVRESIYNHFAPLFLRSAVDALAERRPDLSARTGMAPWQRLVLAIGLGAFLAGLLIAPIETIRAVSLMLAALFVPVVGLRLIAAFDILSGKAESRDQHVPRISDAALPTYTLLVPLLHEAHMLRPLVRALRQLDWPAAKLDIKLILEAADEETMTAARSLRLPDNVEIVVVPEGAPRTKPKALNYALPLARGEYVAIYDAEDRPDRDQLRRAFHAFRSGAPNLATVQARLNIYNAQDSWLTRQFTLEYSALFDGLLPALDRLDLPIPLGGTSNHFRVSALKWLMAWDPYNVTEDADLGTRLARSGYRCRVIGSTTYEEAPRQLGNWLRQRTHWLKGFVQTWLVHMREPRALWRELGPRGFLGFQVMVGGTILSALVHPWFYALAAWEAFGDGFLARPESWFGLPFWGVAWFALAAGYLAAMGLAFLAARRRGLFRLCWQIPLMPLYWLLISTAAYRAVWQFATAPFKWEKTAHGHSASRHGDNSRG